MLAYVTRYAGICLHFLGSGVVLVTSFWLPSLTGASPSDVIICQAVGDSSGSAHGIRHTPLGLQIIEHPLGHSVLAASVGIFTAAAANLLPHEHNCIRAFAPLTTCFGFPKCHVDVLFLHMCKCLITLKKYECVSSKVLASLPHQVMTSAS